jgi:predicted Holliday junction resolvase-like endonuclease
MNAIDWLQQAKLIHGVCPHCGEVFRLSDATVFAPDPPHTTPFDAVRQAFDEHERDVARFEVEREALLAVERDRGAATAHAQLLRLVPDFVGRGIDPEDVKLLCDPVTFIIFRGMGADDVRAIEFLETKPISVERERVLRSVGDAVAAGNIAFATWRITADGRVVVERVIH